MNEIIKNLVETHYNLVALILSIKQHDDEVNLENFEITHINNSYLNVVKALETLIVSNVVTLKTLKSYYIQLIKRKSYWVFDECDDIFKLLDNEEAMLKKYEEIYNAAMNEILTPNESILLESVTEYKTCLDVLNKTKDIYSTFLEEE